MLLMATGGWWKYVSTVVANRPSLVERVSRRASEESLSVPRPPATSRSTVIEGTLARVGRMVGAAGTVLLLLGRIVPVVLPNLAGLLAGAVPSLSILLDLTLAGIVILTGLTAPFRALALAIAQLSVLISGLLLASVVAQVVFPGFAWLVPTVGLLLAMTGSTLRILYSAYVMGGELRRCFARGGPPS
jgi:hypothetical protein